MSTLDQRKVGKSDFEALESYLRTMDEAARMLGENGRFPYWWACANASKNRFTSGVLPLFGTHPLPNSHRSTVIRVALTVKEILGWIRRIYVTKWIWRNVEVALPLSDWVVIKTFCYPSSIRQGAFEDPFFGDLRKHLEDNCGCKVVTLVHGMPDALQCNKALVDSGVPMVFPFELFLSWRDVFRSLGRTVQAVFELRERLAKWKSVHASESATLFASLVKKEGWRVGLSDIVFWSLGKNLGASQGLRAVYLTHEANCWERMFISGLRSSCSAKVLGCQHSVVPPSASGVFETEAELKSAPVPDRVFTTGDYTRDLILRFGDRDEGEVISACALRYGYLFRQETSRIDNGGKCLLVALEGIRAAIDVLDYVLRHAETIPEFEIIVRTHPVLPWEAMAEELPCETFPKNLQISKGRSLQEDLEDASVVMYWGSTVALEALMFGKPIIHFDRGDAISFDPLFGFNDFRWTVESDDPLRATLEEICDLSDIERSEKSEAARKFVANYLMKPTPARIELMTNEV